MPALEKFTEAESDPWFEGRDTVRPAEVSDEDLGGTFEELSGGFVTLSSISLKLILGFNYLQ